MRARWTLSMIVLVLGVCTSAAQEPVDRPPSPPPPSDEGWRDEARPPDAVDRPEAPMSDDRPWRPDMARGAGLRPGRRIEPVLRAIAEHRPDLAERLRHLRDESPERFREVMIDALVIRLEEALDAAEAQGPTEPGGSAEERPPRPPPSAPPERPDFLRESHERMREQHDLHERLERRSHDLAAQLRELRRTGAPREAWAPVRDELHEVLNHQFEVRTRLREFELERIERELQELRRMLQKLQHGLERRAQERDALIQRRFDALLGEDVTDW